MSCTWETTMEIRGDEKTRLLPSLLISEAIFCVFSMLTFDWVSVLTTDLTATFSATAVWATAEPVVVVASRPTVDMMDCSGKLEETSRSEREHSSTIHRRTLGTLCFSLAEENDSPRWRCRRIYSSRIGYLFFPSHKRSLTRHPSYRTFLLEHSLALFVVGTWRISCTSQTLQRKKQVSLISLSLSGSETNVWKRTTRVRRWEATYFADERRHRQRSAYIRLLRFTFLTLRSDW